MGTQSTWGLLSTQCQSSLRCPHPVSKYPSLTMAELGLKKKEIDAIDFAFDVYDFKGDGKVDAFYAGDLIRACNLNPTLKTIAEIGGTTEKGQKISRTFQKNLILSLQNTKSNVAALLRERS